MEEALKDERFSHILTDPRFRKMPKHVKKVTVDKRFKGMFKDKKFKENCMVDKRGRLVNLTQSEKLKNLYEVSSDSNDEEAKSEDKVISNDDKSKHIPGKMSKEKFGKKKAWQKTSYNATEFSGKGAQFNKSYSESESEESEDQISDENKLDQKPENKKLEESVKQKKKLNDKITIEDSSSESDDSDESESDDDSREQNEEFDHHWEEFQNDAADTDEITRRIAVCNMDWDRIRAEDLYICFNSFKPPDSNILSVKIYPSDYGLKRMEEEKIHGPAELVEETLPLEEEVVVDKKGSKYHNEKLRQYQLNRLKYYYAVVECDSPETADTLYTELNGIEYESSSIRFDLRFIPDDVTFDQKPESVVEKVPEPTEYKPRLFVTTALQQVKVNLTWDETDPKRREIFLKSFTDFDSVEKDIQDYIASSSDDDDSVVENSEEEGAVEKLSMSDRISKYKALLQYLEDKEKKEKEEKEGKWDLEITWEPGLKEKTEEIVKEKMKKDSLNMNPFDEMLQKKKEEKKLRKKELKAKQKQDVDESSDISVEGGEGTSDKNGKDSKRLAELALISDSRKVVYAEENSSKKKKKNKAHKLDDFKVNVNDPRFSALYTSHLYNIDPSDPHFKKTEGNFALIWEKQRKLKSSDYSERKPKSKRVKYS